MAGAQHLKETSQSIFRAGKFELHKWHCNAPSLEQANPHEETMEERPTTHQNENQSYAKDQLGVKQGETELLGVPWDKREDTIQTNFPDPITKATKIEVLGKIAKIYDPLGLASSITLEGKFLYRAVCEARIPWEKELTQELEIRWQTWENSLTDKVEVARGIAQHQEEITSINLHTFGDASSQGRVSCSLRRHISTDGGITRTRHSKVQTGEERTYDTKTRTSVGAYGSKSCG